MAKELPKIGGFPIDFENKFWSTNTDFTWFDQVYKRTTNTRASTKGHYSRTLVFLMIYGHVVAIGESFCSDKDKFDKQLGLEIALGRAIKDYKRYNGEKVD